MKKIYRLLAIASLLIVISCKSQTKTKNSETGTSANDIRAADTRDIGIAGCYMQVLNRDTFAASLQQHGNTITGKLSFDNYEKDGSIGTVKGLVENDIVKLFYSFASEGMNSVMEVYFKLENGNLLRGIGDIDNKGDTVYFKNLSSVKYDGGALQKLPCTSLPGKYK